MAAESHILDGLSFTNAAIKIAEPPTFTPAPVRLDWVGGVDSDGTIPVDAGHSDNAVLTIPLRVSQTATADLAWQQIGLIVAKLDQTRRSSTGLVHLWKPKDATATWELRVRSGEIAEFPMDDRGNLLGYLKRFPRITVVLYCDPFLKKQGEVVDFVEVTSTEPVFSISLANVPGHVDAEATVTVTDNASQARRHVEVGMGPTSAAALLIDSASLVTGAGYTGVSGATTGAYGGTAIVGFARSQVQALCGTGNLTHVGPHRVKARLYALVSPILNPAGTLTAQVRLAYRAGDGDYQYTPWITPAVSDTVNVVFSEVDFGVIPIATVGGGTQQWDGRIEIWEPITSVSASASIGVDYLMVLPAERSWKGSATYNYRAGTLIGSDVFSGTPAGTVLNARAISHGGGTWATSGATTDFAAADAPLATDETMARSTTTDTAPGRIGLFGTTTYTNVEVGTVINRTAVGVTGTGLIWRQGLLARYIDTSNYLTAHMMVNAALSGGSPSLVVTATVAGSVVFTAQSGYYKSWQNTWVTLRLIVFASGTWHAVVLDASGAEVLKLEGQHSSLATGGTLAIGKVGIIDFANAMPANTRYFDNFYAASPPLEPLVINSGRATEFRHDSAYRTSSDGLTRGLVNPRGSRAFVPPAGPEARTTRLWAKARRNNVDVSADSNIADSTKLDVQLRPRYRMPTYP